MENCVVVGLVGLLGLGSSVGGAKYLPENERPQFVRRAWLPYCLELGDSNPNPNTIGMGLESQTRSTVAPVIYPKYQGYIEPNSLLGEE
jgi:hypothetical protein